MTKIALVTGATAGIGEAIAKMLAEENYHLIITGRRKDRLEKLANSLSVPTHILHFDVRNRQEVEDVIGSLPEVWQKIDVLVNNAGLAAGLASFEDGDMDNWDRMVDTNVKGLLYMSEPLCL